MLSDMIEEILDYNRGFKRNEVHEPQRSVLDGTNTVRIAVKEDALRLNYDVGRPYLRPGATLDPVLAHHLGRKTL